MFSIFLTHHGWPFTHRLNPRSWIYALGKYVLAAIFFSIAQIYSATTTQSWKLFNVIYNKGLRVKIIIHLSPLFYNTLINSHKQCIIILGWFSHFFYFINFIDIPDCGVKICIWKYFTLFPSISFQLKLFVITLVNTNYNSTFIFLSIIFR